MKVIIEDYNDLLELYEELDVRHQREFLRSLENDIVYHLQDVISMENAEQVVEILNEHYNLNYQKSE